jgi:hypothetical protein
MAQKFMNGIDLQNQRGINTADPSAATDIANKQYVDNVARNLSWKDNVRVATTANGTLASAFANGSSVDGVTLATGDRILIKDQSTGLERGIYVVNASGAPTRASDMAAGSNLQPGTAVTVTEGTTNGDKVFIVTSDSVVVVNTGTPTWGLLGGGGTSYAAGDGLQLASTTFSVKLDTASGLVVGAGGVKIDTAVVARKFAMNIGNGALTTIPVAHNLGTRDVTVSVHDATSYEQVYPDVFKTDANTVNLVFASAPGSNAYRAVVVG